MKTYSKYIALAAMAVSFAACQQEDLDLAAQGDLVRISATIGNLPQTRVSYGDDGTTTFDNGDAIYVQNTMRETKNAATYTYDGANWTTTDVLVWNGGTTANNQFNAWYPASVMTENNGSFTLGSQANGVAASDLMTASTDAMTKPDDGKLTLNFNHLLTKVTVTVTKWGTEIDEDNRYFSGAQIYTNTAITLSGTTIGSSGTPAWIEAYRGTGNEPQSFTAIICSGTPATDTNGYWLKVTAGNGSTFNVKAPSSITSFDAGKHYTFSLTVGKDLVEIGSVSVTAWGEDTIEAPNADEYISNTLDATQMTADQLTTAITEALAYGHTALTVNLPAEDTEATMFTAIAAALAADGIEKGSIDLTISGATSVPENAFNGNQWGNENYYQAATVLKSVSLPDATVIGDYAFWECTSITGIDIPNATTIGAGAFFTCTMTSVYAPQAVTIGDEAFEGCTSLAEVNLPLVQTIGAMAFSECSALKEISLPECTSIGSTAFNCCKALQTFYAPKATTIESIAFHECDALTKVTFGALTSVAGGSNAIFLNVADPSSIDLVLSSGQKVMTYNESTKYWTVADGAEAFSFDNATSFINYTFKSITAQGTEQIAEE